MPAAAASQERLPAAGQTWTPDKDEQDDVAAINATLSRLRTATGPDPYVLTIPQEVEPRYHHQHRAWAEQWLSNAPFERGEHESLQYQTFFFHEHGKDMYVLQNSRPPADEPRANGNTRAKPATGANTPNTAPKKKISLGTYKKQRTGAIDTPERDALKGSEPPIKQAAVKGPVERVKTDTEEVLAAVAEDGELAPVEETKPRTEKNDLKRKREETAAGRNNKLPLTKQEVDAAARNISAEPPVKKPKVSTSDAAHSGHAKKPSVSSARSSQKAPQQPESVITSMPPRLSPGMPPRLSPGLPEKLSPLRKVEDSPSRKQTAQTAQTAATEPEDKHNLPPRLSPTIPENIAKTLEARTDYQSTPQPLDVTSAPGSAIKNKEDRLTPAKKLDSITKRRSPAPINGFRANSSSPAIRSDAEEKQRPVFPVYKSKTPTSSQDEPIAVGKASNVNLAERNWKEGRMVVLKYKRSRREAVLRILKLPPTPAKDSYTQPTPPQPRDEQKLPEKSQEKPNGERKESGPVKGVAQKIGPVKKEKKPRVPQEDKPPVVEKRPAPEDEISESPAKRKRPDVSEVRKDPATPAQREVDSPLASKSAQQVTPGVRKDILSAAMRREQSQDSTATYNTPPELSNTPTISNYSSQVNGARAPSSQPTNTTPKQQAWEVEQRRLEALGRELKHAASAHLNASQQDSSTKVAEQRLAAMKCIESFLCFLVAFTCADEAASAAEPRQSPPYKLWRSLSGFFGFVKKTTEPFGPLSGLACTLGMVFNARILAIATKFPNDGPSRSELLETLAQMQRSATEAETKLDTDLLQDAFPRSWKERTKKTNSASEKLDPAKLGGPYKLPIGVSTPPLRAARAGHAMLLEWVEKEKISYNSKLKL